MNVASCYQNFLHFFGNIYLFNDQLFQKKRKHSFEKWWIMSSQTFSFKKEKYQLSV
jgi:hypothetical protein